MAKRVLVTGGTGFIGQSLIPILKSHGYSVRVLARRRPDQDDVGVDQWHIGDITAPKTLVGMAEGCSTIFHLAGYAHATSKPHPDEVARHRQINLNGTEAVLHEAVHSSVKRFVFVSSVKAAGEDHVRCIDETSIQPPRDHYGSIKLDCERLVFEICSNAGIHAAVIRPALVYGTAVKGNLASMSRWVERRIFPPVPDVGNVRSMVEVRDLARAIIAASERDIANGKAYIITDGEKYSTRRIYEALVRAHGRKPTGLAVPATILRLLGALGDGLEKLTGRSLPFNGTGAERLLESACYQSVLAKSELGFEPEFSFEDVVGQLACGSNQRA